MTESRHGGRAQLFCAVSRYQSYDTDPYGWFTAKFALNRSSYESRRPILSPRGVQPERNLQRENVQWRPCERIHANRALPRADPVSEAGCTRMERLVKLSYAIRLREYQLSALGPRAVASRHLRPHCDRRGRVRGVSSTTIIRSDSVLYEPRRFGTVAVLHVAWRFDFTRPSNTRAVGRGGKTRGKRAVEARECLQSQRTAVSDAAAARAVCIGCWTRMRNAGRDRCGRFQPVGRPRPVRQFRAPSLPLLLFYTLRELSHVTIINYTHVTKFNKSTADRKRKAREIALSTRHAETRCKAAQRLSAHSLLPHCSDRRSHAQTHHCPPLGTW